MRSRDRFAAPAKELAAWEDFDRALNEAGASDPVERAETYLGLAIARFYAKQYAAGLSAVESARAMVGRLPDPPPFHSELLSYGALLLLELDRIEEAQAYAGEALAIAEARGGSATADVALAHNALGAIAYARNDLPAAETRFCTARDLTLTVLPPADPMIVTNATSCAVVKYFLERPDTLAAMRFASDHALAYLPPDHPRMGNVLNGAYGIMVRYGRYADAEPLIRRHLELERSLHENDADDLYDPLSMLGRVLALEGRLEEAESIAAAAADMAARLDNRSEPYKAGLARINLAHVIGRQGRLAEAEAMARAGVERLREELAPGDWHIGSGLAVLADVLLRRGNSQALASAREAVALLEAGLPEGHSEILSARLVLARALGSNGRGAEGLDLAREAAQAFESRILDLTASEVEQVALSQVLSSAFADYLTVALATGEMADAVHAAQLQLMSELAATNARIGAGAMARSQGLNVAVDRLEEARSSALRLADALAAAQAEAGRPAGEIAQQLLAARREAERAQEALLAEFPEFVTLTRPRVPGLAELQAALASDELLVLPIGLADRAVTLLVANDSVAWAETPIGAYRLNAEVSRLRGSVERGDAFDAAAAHALFRTVFPESLHALLASRPNLLFPASGYLSRISPAILLTQAAPDGPLASAPWLMRTHASRIVPDFADLRGGTSRAAALHFLGVGAPLIEGKAALALADEPPLTAAQGELAAIGEALGAAEITLLTGAGATEAALRENDLARFGVLAFATHGLVGGQLPGLGEPALVMTQATPGSEHGDDGLLTASEVARLDLAADWVLLSACNTGAGSGVNSPSFSGLARAFIQAGARSLMVSHWRVRDDAAAILSVGTVRRAAGGVPRAEALRQAQMELIGNASVPNAAHPSVWAPFVILGS